MAVRESQRRVHRRVLQINFRPALGARDYTSNEIIACERTHFPLVAVIIPSENCRHADTSTAITRYCENVVASKYFVP